MLYKLGSEPLNSWANHCFGNSSSQIVLISLSSGHPSNNGSTFILPTAQIKPQQCLQPRADLQTNGSAFILPTIQIKPQQYLQLRAYLQTNGSAFNSLTATSYENNNFIQMSLTELRPTPSSKGRPLL